MKKKRRRYYFCMIIMIGAAIMTGCQKDTKSKVIQQFVSTQINDKICKLIYDAPEEAKSLFLDFFTEEAYEKYLADEYGNLYPELFRAYTINAINIQHIDCRKVKKIQDQGIYECEVKYIIRLEKEKEENKAESIEMVDHFQVTIDQNDKISNAIILNTSDIIKKLILDVKVQ